MKFENFYDEIINGLYNKLTGEPYHEVDGINVKYRTTPSIYLSNDDAINYIKKHCSSYVIPVYKNNCISCLSRWVDVIYIANLYLDGKIEMINAEWLNNSYHPKNTPYIGGNSAYEKYGDLQSYEGCHSIFIEIKDNEYIVSIIVYNGDTYTGNRNELSCKFEFKITDIDIKNYIFTNYIYPRILNKVASDIIEEIKHKEIDRLLNVSEAVLENVVFYNKLFGSE